MKYLSFKSKHCPTLLGEQAKQVLDYLLDTNLETEFRYTLRNPQDTCQGFYIESNGFNHILIVFDNSTHECWVESYSLIKIEDWEPNIKFFNPEILQNINPLTEELIVFNFKNPKNLCQE